MIPTVLAHADAALHIHPETVVAIAAVLGGLSRAAVRMMSAARARKAARRPPV